jgi:hypothetical protein
VVDHHDVSGVDLSVDLLRLRDGTLESFSTALAEAERVVR